MLLTLMLLSSLGHAQCGGDLDHRIDAPASIPRIRQSRLTRNPYLLTEGPERLDYEQPARILQIDGADSILVLDARRAYAGGVAPLLARLGFADDARTRAWIAKIEDHFAGFTEDTFVVKDLASLWSARRELTMIDQIFFTRFFASVPSRASVLRSDVYACPERADRIALISLLDPSRPRWQLPVVTPPPSTRARIDISAAAPRRDVGTSSDILMQLPPRHGKGRVVMWNVTDLPKPANQRKIGRVAKALFFERFIPRIADFKRSATGSPDVLLPWFDLSDGDTSHDAPGMLYALHYTETRESEVIAVQSATPASWRELLRIQADFNARVLEPSEPTIYPEIRVAASLLATSQQTISLIGINQVLESLTMVDNRRLEHLADGHSITIFVPSRKDHLRDLRKPDRFIRGRELIFRRSGDEVFLVGFIKVENSNSVREL